MELKGEARLVALDISKAFDTVWHKGLLNKIILYAASGVINSIILAFLTNRKNKVVLEGQSSPSNSINSGVPQGFVLCPTLFLVYINDLPDNVLSQLAMYADDSSLYCASADSLNSIPNEVGVSRDNDLENVLLWRHDWLVTFKRKRNCCPHLTLETGISLLCTWGLQP